MTMTKETSARHVSRLVKSAIKAYGRAQDVVQQAGLAIIAHTQAYGDCSQAAVLVKGVPARERNSLIGWFQLFSPIGVREKRDIRGQFEVKLVQESTVQKFRENQKLEGAKDFPLFHLEGAKAHPWYTDPSGKNPAPPPLNTVVNFYETIDRMLKKVIKDAENSTADAESPKYDPEQAPVVRSQAEELLSMFNKFKAEHMDETIAAKEGRLPVKANGSDSKPPKKERGAGKEPHISPKKDQAKQPEHAAA